MESVVTATIQRIQLRRDTSTNWSANNPILAQGEAGFALDTNDLRIGNGSAAWSELISVGSGGIQETRVDASAAAYAATLPAASGNGPAQIFILVDGTNGATLSPASGERIAPGGVDQAYDLAALPAGTRFLLTERAAGVWDIDVIGTSGNAVFQTQVETLVYGATAVEGVSYTHSHAVGTGTNQIDLGPLYITRHYIGGGMARVTMEWPNVPHWGTDLDVTFTLPQGYLTEYHRGIADRNEINVADHIVVASIGPDQFSVNRDDDISGSSPFSLYVSGIGKWVGDTPNPIVPAGFAALSGGVQTIRVDAAVAPFSSVLPAADGSNGARIYVLADPTQGAVIYPAAGEQIIPGAANEGFALSNWSAGTRFLLTDRGSGVWDIDVLGTTGNGLLQTQVETLIYGATAVEGVSYTHNSSEGTGANQVQMGPLHIARRYIGNGMAHVTLEWSDVPHWGADLEVTITLPTGYLTEYHRGIVDRNQVNVANEIVVTSIAQDKFSINRDDDIDGSSPFTVYVSGIGKWVGAVPVVGKLAVDGGGVTPSDAALKDVVDSIDKDLAASAVADLRPTQFRWKSDGPDGVIQDGFIAQDILAVLPNAVSGDGTAANRYRVDYHHIVANLTAAVQQLQERVAALEQPPSA